MKKRKAAILPIIMISFVVAFILFTVGINLLEINNQEISFVKNNFDTKSILSNYHQLSLSRVICILNGESGFPDDLWKNTQTLNGFETFFNDFKNKTNSSVFKSQWENILNKVDKNNYNTILRYKKNDEDKALPSKENEIYKQLNSYLNAFPEISSAESVLIKIKGNNYKAALVNKLEVEIKKDSFVKMYGIALIQKSAYNKFLYFTENEPEIWFNDGDIITGPLCTLGTLHIAGHPQFNGTVYYGGDIEYYDENSSPIFNGNPPTNPLSGYTDSFNQIKNNYADRLKKGLYFDKILPSHRDDTVMNFNTYPEYSASTSSDIMSKFTPLILSATDDYFSGNVYVDFEKGKIKIKRNNRPRYRLEIYYTAIPTDNAIFKLFDRNTLITETKNIPFSGFLSFDSNVYIGDFEGGSSDGVCFYDGKLTIHSKKNIYVEDNLIPIEVKEKLNPEITAEWLEETNTQVSEFVKNDGNAVGMINIIAQNSLLIGSDQDGAKTNQKIFASLYSFENKVSVYNHDRIGPKGQLTIFGSIMQKTRGPVGTFGTEKILLYENYIYDDYDFTEGKLYGRNKYYSGWDSWWGEWKLLYTTPDNLLEKAKFIQGYYGWYTGAEVYYQKTATTSGYDKNYIHDPRFMEGFEPPQGTPTDEKDLQIILQGLIEVF